MLMRLKVVTSFTLGRGNSDPCTQGFRQRFVASRAEYNGGQGRIT